MRHQDPVRQLLKLDALVRRDLLRVLSEPDQVRADVIGQMHARREIHDLAEVLIDIEADPILRLDVLRALRDSLADADRR
jgi:hypothetical protein